MPLPELPITTPEQLSYRADVESPSLAAMLEALHAGVLELGVGQCRIQQEDNPRGRTLGYILCAERGGFTREWAFCIRLSHLKDMAPSPLKELVRTPAGRRQIAEALERGLPLSALASIFDGLLLDHRIRPQHVGVHLVGVALGAVEERHPGLLVYRTRSETHAAREPEGHGLLDDLDLFAADGVDQT